MQELKFEYPGIARWLALAWMVLGLAGCSQEPLPPVEKPAPVVDFNATKTKAEGGDAAAQNALGDLYARGQGVKQDYKLAAQWYRSAADQGLAVAQYNLGTLFASGANGKTDAAEAVKWYRMAVDNGSLDALYNLAEMVSMGIGTKRDLREAIRLYQVAAERGDGLSQFNLARRYREGKDVPLDLVLAYVWFVLAAENGVSDAVAMRDSLKKEMSRSQIAEADRKVAEFKAKPPSPKSNTNQPVKPQN